MTPVLNIYPGVPLERQTPTPCSICGALLGLPTRDLEAERAYVREVNAERLAAARAVARKEGRPVIKPALIVERRWFCSTKCLDVAAAQCESADELDAKAEARRQAARRANAKRQAAKAAKAGGTE